LAEEHEEPHTAPTTGAREDLGAGQIVIVVARWLLIVTGFIVTLWSPSESELNPVRTTLLVLFGLAIANFFIHAQILMRRPLERRLLYAASAADIGIITLIIWAYGGLGAASVVYYYPALLALSLVFPLPVAACFAVGTVAAYAMVAMPVHATTGDMQVLAARVISLVAVAAVGWVYQGIEHRRRAREAVDGAFDPEALLG